MSDPALPTTRSTLRCPPAHHTPSCPRPAPWHACERQRGPCGGLRAACCHHSLHSVRGRGQHQGLPLLHYIPTPNKTCSILRIAQHPTPPAAQRAGAGAARLRSGQRQGLEEVQGGPEGGWQSAVGGHRWAPRGKYRQLLHSVGSKSAGAVRRLLGRDVRLASCPHWMCSAYCAVAPGGATLLVSLQMHCNRNLAFTLARSPPLPAFAASKKVTLTLKPSVVGSKLPPITCLQVGWGRRWELKPAALAARAAASPCGIDTRTDR